MTDELTALALSEESAKPAKPNGFLMNPENFEEAMKFCEMMAGTEVVPKAFKNKPGDIFAACQWGSELGLMPMQALQNIAVINGRPSLWGDAILAIIQQHPAYAGHEERNSSEALKAEAGLCIIRRVDSKTGKVMEFRGSFTKQEAVMAGLWDKQGPWTNYPGRMLQLRARAFAARDGFADALRGLSIAEEVQDYDVVKTDDPDVDLIMPRRLDGGTARAAQRGTPSGNGGAGQAAPQRRTTPTNGGSGGARDGIYRITGIEEKDGKNGPYLRVTLQAPSGQSKAFSCFDETACMHARDVGDFPVIVTFKSSKDGKYQNITSIEAAPEDQAGDLFS